MTAVFKLNYSDFEVILVDNNSSNEIPVKTFRELKNNYITPFHYLQESKQGLANARICGVNAAQGEWIVFVDDDNVLNSDYLYELEEVINQYPSCVCWGPGIIDVCFTGVQSSFIKKYCKKYFQEKKIEGTHLGIDKSWSSYYPTGSGMTIRKDIFCLYRQNYLSGSMSLSGRKGEDLSSGEDAQIIWTCILSGYMVGSSGTMVLKHIIDENRCDIKYLTRLNFSVSRDYYLANWQMFHDEKIFSEEPGFTHWVRLLFNCIKITFPNFISMIKLFRVEREWVRGYYCARNLFSSSSLLDENTRV